MVDEFRRIFCESILPWLMQHKEEVAEGLKKKLSIGVKNKTHNVDSPTTIKLGEEIVDMEMKELERDEIEIFDDYCEMVMTFGYITLFASSFAFGSTITVIFIYLEIRSDIFKMEKCGRRPFSRKTDTIGTWNLPLKLYAYLSIFTNLILMCFATDQIDMLLPWMA